MAEQEWQLPWFWMTAHSKGMGTQMGRCVTSLLHAYYFLKSFLGYIANAPIGKSLLESLLRGCADVNVEEGVDVLK